MSKEPKRPTSSATIVVACTVLAALVAVFLAQKHLDGVEASSSRTYTWVAIGGAIGLVIGIIAAIVRKRSTS